MICARFRLLRRCSAPLFLNILLFTLCCFTPLFGETYVSGEVSGIWTVEGSPYIVEDSLFILADDTLYITPGVRVEFANESPYNRTPIMLYGSLFAMGDEGDSITFASGSVAFQGFRMNDPDYHPRLEMQYCILDSVHRAIRARNATILLRHNRIMTRNYFCYNQYCTEIIDYNTIVNPIVHDCRVSSYIYHSDTLVIRNNTGPMVDFTITDCPELVVHQNAIVWISIAGSAGTISDNTMQTISTSGSELIISGNTLPSTCYFSQNTNLEICNNELGNLEFQGQSINFIHDNRFLYMDGQIEISGGTCDIRRNLLKKTILNDNTEADIYSNTFHYSDHAVTGSDMGDVLCSQNIFLDTDEASTALVLESGEAPTVAYSCFFGMSQIAEGFEVGGTNMTIDPRFRAGDPFDYRLQANSPCIDAGEYFSTRDPDNTRADIGAIFFDQSIDNPPCIIAPVFEEHHPGDMLRCVLFASDDNGPLLYRFRNLPDWFVEENTGLDHVSDSLYFVGVIPLNQRTINFKVYVQDGVGQIDSATVFVPIVRGQLEDMSGIQTETKPTLPTEFSVDAPYPNPFNAVQNFRFALPQTGKVTIRIVNIEGRQVGMYSPGTLEAGQHTFTWQPEQLASGVYFLAFTAENHSQVVKSIMLK